MLAAQNEIVIVSPFLTKRRVLTSLNYLAAANAKVTVVTKPPDNYADKEKGKINECIELLLQHGIAVKTKDRIHQKFAVIDQRLVWYGSINPDISYGFVTRRRKRAWIQGVRSEGDEGILHNMSRRPNKRNAVDMPDCVAAVETV